jgi:hypothetical protein
MFMFQITSLCANRKQFLNDRDLGMPLSGNSGKNQVQDALFSYVHDGECRGVNARRIRKWLSVFVRFPVAAAQVPET